jgi:tRNA(fMet)-specific endonuclease VapC
VAKPAYLLDLAVIAELTRPDGNRRVFNLFQQRHAACALAAPALVAWLRGLDGLPESPRRQQLAAFTAELLHSGPVVLSLDRDAAIWLSRQASRWDRSGRPWTRLDGEQAAIAATRELTLVVRSPYPLAGTDSLKLDDWFRP